MPTRTSGPRWKWEVPILIAGLILSVVSGVVAYRIGGPHGERLNEDPRVRQVFDEDTGNLTLVIYDYSGDLRFDTWAYMNGGNVVRVEQDTDEDGVVDSWEYYRPDLSQERLEEDTNKDGRPDRRILLDATGNILSETEIGQ